jgi:hypothetical protein
VAVDRRLVSAPVVQRIVRRGAGERKENLMADETPPGDGEVMLDDFLEEHPFVAWLSAHKGGSTLIELDGAFADLVKEVRELGKAGTLTLVAKIATQGVTHTVTEDVKVKMPEPPQTADYFYADDDGALHRDDPRQQKLGLKDVDKIPVGTLRDVSDPARKAAGASA